MPKVLTLTSTNKNFPEGLLALPKGERPTRLFVLGKIKPQDKKAIAIVGSRKMTDYGEKIAGYFAKCLASCGFTIVSGLAKGIDSVVHKKALSAGGRTIAVLGSGVDVIYPSENKSLAKKVVEFGAIVSEFDLGEPPLAKNFLARNRIIAGLSLGVIVVEGKRRSGTLSTASWAASYGREVFAVPGPVDSPLSEAPHYLIRNGAKLVTRIEDVLEEFENMLE
jgi:DNA processing protein